MIKRPTLLFLLGLPLFGQACSTGMKNIVQTGVNEIIAPVSPHATENDMEARRKPDPTPYSGLRIEGPLPKSAVVRAVNQNRRALNRCYRDIFEVEERLREREEVRTFEKKHSMRPYTMDDKVQADGLRNSTNFNTPFPSETPTMAGDVIVHFHVDTEGKVHDVRISLSDLKDSRFHACLEKAVAGFQFGNQKSDTMVKSLFLRFDQESGFVKSEN